ncbi:MAG: phage tail protein [Candidatus Asgardarchaeia archaeon]
MIEGIKFDVGLNTRNFQAGIKSMSSSLKSLDSGLNRLKNTVLGLVSAWASLTTIKKSVALFAEQESATLKLAFATQRFTKNAKETFNAINRLANSLQASIGVGNEYTQNLAAIGLSYGIMEDKLTKATEASILMSKVIGTDAQTIMRGFAQTLQGQLGILGRYVPELRNLTEEQLKSGKAIDYIVNKFAGLRDVFGNTTQANLDKIKAYLGDIGEYLGAIFAPAVKKTADIVSWFANALANPSQALDNIKKKIIDFYNNLSPVGKALIAIGTAFLVFQTAVGAWNLLVKAIGIGGSVIVKVFNTLFSWPFWLVLGLSVLYVAWEDNWFGIKNIVKKVWEKIEPIFMSMWNWITKGWNWIINIVGEGWEWLKNVAMPFLGQVFETTWNWVTNIAGQLWNFVNDIAIPWIGKTLSTTWSWIANFIGDAWNFLRNKAIPWIGKTLLTIWGWTIKMLGEGWQFISNSFSWIGGIVGTIWQWSVKVVGDVWNWIWNTALPWLGNAVETAWNWIVEASGNLWEILGDIWDWIGGALTTAWDWTLNLFDNIGKGFIWLWDNILKPLSLGIWETLKTSWDFTLQVSSNIVKGFIWFWDNILKPLLENMFDTFKTTWKIAIKIATDIGKGFVWFYDNVLKRFANSVFKTTWEISIKRGGKVAEIFENIKEDFEKQNWLGIGIDIASFINQGIATTFDIAGAIFKSATQAVIDLRQGLGGIKQSLIESYKAILQSSSEEAGQAVNWQSMFESLKQVAKEAGISDVISSMLALGLQIGEALKQGVLLVFDLAEIFGLVIANISAMFYKKTIEPLGKKIGESLGDGFKNVLDFVGWIGEKTKDVWNGIVELGKQIGEAIVSGIKQIFSALNPLNWFKKPTEQEIREWVTSSGGGGGGSFRTGGYTSAFYQEGGFAPDIGVSQIAGVVHGGEWVAPAWMVRKYKGFFAMLESLRQKGYQNGGPVNVQIGSRAWYDLPWEKRIQAMFESYTRIWGNNITVVLNYIKQLAQKMGLELPKEVVDSINSLNNLEGEFNKIKKQLGTVGTKFDELANATDQASKKISESTQIANSALQAFASHIEWLSYSNGGLRLDLGAGIGNFINILLGGLPQIFPVLNWVFNPFSALANFILDALSGRNAPQGKEPYWETTPEGESTYGQTFTAGTPQEITYNYNFIFKENYVLTEDSEAVRRFTDLIYAELRNKGAVKVVSG